MLQDFVCSFLSLLRVRLLNQNLANVYRNVRKPDKDLLYCGFLLERKDVDILSEFSIELQQSFVLTRTVVPFGHL